jgi:hypothetical protein
MQALDVQEVVLLLPWHDGSADAQLPFFSAAANADVEDRTQLAFLEPRSTGNR